MNLNACPDPSRPAAPRAAQAEVLENRRVIEGIHELVLSVPGPWGPGLAGQFVQLQCPPRETFGLPRPFSLAGCRTGAESANLEIVYGVVGTRTRELSRLRKGETIGLSGPFGRPFTPLPGRRAVLVGGGRGLAPVLMLARQWSAVGRDDPSGAVRPWAPPAVLVYGARTAGLLLPVETPPCPLRLATDDGSAGFPGTVIELLEAMVAGGDIDPAGDAVHACGPNAMLAALAGWCDQRGIPCQASLETRFGCGMGICAGCAIPLRPGARAGATAFDRFVFACREGPVFDAALVEWEGVHE